MLSMSLRTTRCSRTPPYPCLNFTGGTGLLSSNELLMSNSLLGWAQAGNVEILETVEKAFVGAE